MFSWDDAYLLIITGASLSNCVGTRRASLVLIVGVRSSLREASDKIETCGVCPTREHPDQPSYEQSIVKCRWAVAMPCEILLLVSSILISASSLRTQSGHDCHLINGIWTFVNYPDETVIWTYTYIYVCIFVEEEHTRNKSTPTLLPNHRGIKSSEGWHSTTVSSLSSFFFSLLRREG